MHFLSGLIDFIVHIDVHLGEIIKNYGPETYAILFGIVFAETGFVLTPFLPGDSLLFAAGAFAALGSLSIAPLYVVFLVAALLGDNANYWLGRFLGRKMIDSPFIPINDKHIEKTNAYFLKYGGKTIFVAKFIPIVRTFAPFVAGIGKMPYGNFLRYNISGAFTWVTLFVFAGYFFGNIPLVKNNFTYAVMAIILLSLSPLAVAAFRTMCKKKLAR